MADSAKKICKWLERIAEQVRNQNKLLKQADKCNVEFIVKENE